MSNRPNAVIVTGGAHGIGKAAIERFAASDEFDEAVIFDIRDDLDEIAVSINGCKGYCVDVSEHDAVQEAVGEIEKKYDIDAAVNNAMTNSPHHIRDLEPEEWDRVMETNIKGYYNLARAVCPRMHDREYGRIVNISSGAGQRGSLSGGVHYSASKAGAIGFTKALAKQFHPHVHVNCIVPGLIDTFAGKKREHGQLWTDRGLEKYLSMLPLQRLGEPDEVARVIQFLCGEGADFMTGSVVNVDGGGGIVPTRDFLMEDQ